ncbi:MAG: fatty acid desaturase [Rhodospirillales bacterium]
MPPFETPPELAIPHGNAAEIRGRRTGAGHVLRIWERAEGTTWLLIVTIYGGWSAILAASAWLPLWIVCPLAAVFGAWHAHLQHELLHGHPMQRQWLNDMLAILPISLVYPYTVYKRSHLEHHISHLTDPLDDPESYYVTPARWATFGPLRRAVMVANNTLLGRLVLGPWLSTASLFNQQSRRLFAGELLAWGEWTLHGLLIAVMLWTIDIYTSVSPWLYVFGIAYPATGLAMVRSFLEHRPAKAEDHRTAVVEAGWFWSLLFLNNNLHVLHHERPGVPWYQLHKIYAKQRDAILERNGGYVYNGYLDVARRYLVTPKDLPVHPA